MFWFDKDNPFVEFMDIRDEECYTSLGQLVMVHPNTIGDFTDMPYDDNSFNLVVFDPPHLTRAGKSYDLCKKYGTLGSDWKDKLTKGFSECFRVLKPFGTLVFKWNESGLKLKTVLDCTKEKPLFGHRRGKTIWVAFMKFPKSE